MKSITIIGLFAILAAGQQLDKASVVAQFDKGKTREQIGHKLVPGGTAPAVQELTPRFTAYHPSVKRTKIRYGPYTMPSTQLSNAMSVLTGEKGTMTSFGWNMKKPCEGSCNIVMAQAGLEYANGSVADNSNGAWLHHIVMLANGGSRKDNVCPGRFPLPGERFFSSGNERTPTTFGDVINASIRSAFPITSADTFLSQFELMNLAAVSKTVYITIEWEHIPGPKPADFRIAKAMWLDVTDCGISSAFAPSGKSAFTLTMDRKWVAGFNGQLLGVGGHLHDGGTHVNIYKNNKVICKSDALYGQGESVGHPHVEKGSGGSKEGAGSGAGAGPKGKGARPAGKAAFVTEEAETGLVRRDQPGISSDGKQHIVKMTTCTLMGPVKKGDVVYIDANYDYKQHQRAPGAVMGIAILYAAADPN